MNTSAQVILRATRRITDVPQNQALIEYLIRSMPSSLRAVKSTQELEDRINVTVRAFPHLGKLKVELVDEEGLPANLALSDFVFVNLDYEVREIH